MENVAGDSGDRFQRYQMPRIVTKVEGKGNGIKTVFPNIYEVGLSLKRDPAYITRYFGYEFGALSQYNERTKTGVVNGMHSWNDVHELLKNFIRTFVICQNCHNPETDFGKTGGALTMHCLACGGVSHCPPSHRLTLSILKEIEMMKKAKKGGRAGREEKAARDGAEERKSSRKPKASEEEEAAVASSEEEPKHPKAASKEKPAREEKSAPKHEDAAPAPDDEEKSWDSATTASEAEDADAPVDTIDEAAFRPPPRPSPKAESAVVGSHSPPPAPSPKPTASPPTPVAAPPNPFDALLGRTFDQGIDEAKVIKATPILKPLLSTQMAQLQLLIALERLLTQRNLVPRAAPLVKFFYDADLLPEEALLLWGDHPEMMEPLGAEVAMDRALRAACQPLLTWLKTAEEDEDEEEEEDEGKAGAKPSADAFIDSL